MRIKSKLTVTFLAVAVIPMLLVGYFIFYNSRNSLQVQILHALEANAEFKANTINDYILERKSDLFILQNRNVIKSFLPVLDQFKNDPSNLSYVEAKKTVDAQLVIMQKAYNYVDIMLVNKEGIVIYVTNPQHQIELNKPLVNKEEVLQKVKASAYIGEVHRFDSKEHPYCLDLAGAVSGSANEFAGLVYVELCMRPMYEITQKVKIFGPSMEVLLVKKTADNKVLFLSPLKGAPDAALEKTVPLGSQEAIPAQKAALGETGSGISVDYRGKKVLSAWRPISVLGWGLVAKVDVEEAFASINKLEEIVETIFILFIVLLVLVALAVAKSIANPILKLSHGAEMVGKGQLDYKIDVTVKDEIGDLAKAFNAMAKNIKDLMQKEREFAFAEARLAVEKKKTDELRALNQQLRANEQQLKAANQQLSATEQQLRASNQQLTANEQQLKAANQQLLATEQQLRATNQQLLANEQALRTSQAGLEEKVRERTRELAEAKYSLEAQVQERTRELEEKMANLEKMNKFMVDRELRIIELKKEVNKLCLELGRPEQYKGGVS
ncbi:MAG: HAMP domain-containing protein [Candidatus Omnitrophica bacterium]|nr:HAMP domain-containing protein [Candidatus Omnitrophota bacterium]